MVSLDPTNARCLVYVFRGGELSSLGHDLVLRVERFTATIEPGPSITAEAHADSLRMEGVLLADGRVDATVLPERDVREIEQRTDAAVLHPKKHPLVRFRSKTVARSGDAARVVGFLALHGVEREVEVRVERKGDDVVARATLEQPAFGIVPFTTAFGALQVRDDVEVVLTAPAALVAAVLG